MSLALLVTNIIFDTNNIHGYFKGLSKLLMLYVINIRYLIINIININIVITFNMQS